MVCEPDIGYLSTSYPALQSLKVYSCISCNYSGGICKQFCLGTEQSNNLIVSADLQIEGALRFIIKKKDLTAAFIHN